MEGQGVVPVMDIAHNNTPIMYDGYGGYGGGCWFMWIIILFFLIGGNGWGNRNGLGLMEGQVMNAINANGTQTREAVYNGFNNQDVMNGIRGIQDNLTSEFYTQSTNMMNGFNNLERSINGVDKTVMLGFNDTQKTNMQGFYSIDKSLMGGFNNVGQGLAENRFTMQHIGCETNRNIDSLKAENYRNTCEIKTALHNEGEATRALIAANHMQDLRDRLTAKDQELQTANFQLSQMAQSANIINQLRPYPTPAYITASPYTSLFNTNVTTNGGCPCMA